MDINEQNMWYAPNTVLLYHDGSVIVKPSFSLELGSTTILQSTTSAHMLKVDAMGPNVAAINGKRVDTIHHRLRENIKSTTLHI